MTTTTIDGSCGSCGESAGNSTAGCPGCARRDRTAISGAGNTYEFVVRKGTRGYYVVVTDPRVHVQYGPYATDGIANVAAETIARLMNATGAFPPR